MQDVAWPDEIETERLRLRPVRLDDASGLFDAYAGDARVTRYLTWRPNGLMTEAVRAVVALAQQNSAVFRIWAYRDVDHPASGRVLEKAGLAREAVLRRWAVHPNLSDEPRDAVIHSWTR